MNKSLFAKLGFGILTLTAVFLFAGSCAKTSTATDPRATQVAQALTEAGVKFYGAFWCPHCADQKTLFGDAVKELPYVECSTPDKQRQTQVCIDAGIKAYPTWEFQDGSRYEGVLSLDELITKANLNIATQDSPGPVAPS